MHLIKFWPGDWFKQMKKMNQAVVENNSLDTTVGRKCPVGPFIKNNIWKCIGYIISAVTFGVKLHQLWGKPESSVSKKVWNPL